MNENPRSATGAELRRRPRGWSMAPRDMQATGWMCSIVLASCVPTVPSPCPTGWQKVHAHLEGRGKLFSHGLSVDSCATLCRSRFGCMAFEYNSLALKCGTYTDGEARYEDAIHEDWVSCVKRTTTTLPSPPLSLWTSLLLPSPPPSPPLSSSLPMPTRPSHPPRVPYSGFHHNNKRAAELKEDGIAFASNNNNTKKVAVITVGVLMMLGGITMLICFCKAVLTEVKETGSNVDVPTPAPSSAHNQDHSIARVAKKVTSRKPRRYGRLQAEGLEYSHGVPEEGECQPVHNEAVEEMEVDLKDAEHVQRPNHGAAMNHENGISRCSSSCPSEAEMPPSAPPIVHSCSHTDLD